MKTLVETICQGMLRAGLPGLVLIAGSAQVIGADAIPYPASGTPNAVSYTFVAASSGPVTAYFAGSGAAYDNELTMLVNGVPTGIVGLDNHTSALGDSLVLGTVTAGDTLVFELVNHTLGMSVYSDPSLNGGYDTDGSVGHNHVYATPYTATSPIIDSIPVGTFVSFEDLPFPGSDFNYHDEDFVFVNVGAVPTPTPDSASTFALLSMGLAGLNLVRRRICA